MSVLFNSILNNREQSGRYIVTHNVQFYAKAGTGAMNAADPVMKIYTTIDVNNGNLSVSNSPLNLISTSSGNRNNWIGYDKTSGGAYNLPINVRLTLISVSVEFVKNTREMPETRYFKPSENGEYVEISKEENVELLAQANAQYENAE